MNTKELSVGILAPLPEMRDSLAAHVEATQIASVTLTVTEYCAVEDDPPTQSFIGARPDIGIIDMQDPKAAIKSLVTLHSVLPETRLFACGSSSDPQLIIETMQAGAREFLACPISPLDISVAFNRYLDERQRLRPDSKSHTKIYSVTSAKGGVGATFVAVNVAATLASVPRTRVAVLDMNSAGDAASYLNLSTEFTIADALAAARKLDPVLLDTYMTKAGNVSLLSGLTQFKTRSPADSEALSKLLRVLSCSFTHVLIDLPSFVNNELLRIVTEASEAVLLVMTPELPAIWRTHRLLANLTSFKSADRVRLILNRDDSRNEIDAKEIAKALNHPIFWRLPNNYGTAIQAINIGKPILEVNNSNLAASYRLLAENLTGVFLPEHHRGVSRFLRILAKNRSAAEQSENSLSIHKPAFEG
jgi:pilus assembly protein CpaE